MIVPVATTYDPSIVYDEGDVVIGPDGNTWISEYSNNMNWPSIVWNWNNWFTFTIPTWRMCSVSTCADAIPWDQNTALYGGYFSGDAVSHVGTSWVLMQGQSGTSIEPSLSMIINLVHGQLATQLRLVMFQCYRFLMVSQMLKLDLYSRLI